MPTLWRRAKNEQPANGATSHTQNQKRHVKPNLLLPIMPKRPVTLCYFFPIFFVARFSENRFTFFSLFINFFWLVSSLISALALRLSYKDACIFNVIAYTGFEYLARTGCYVNLMNSMRELFTEGAVAVAVAVATIQLPGLVFSTNWIFCASWNGINCLARDTHTRTHTFSAYVFYEVWMSISYAELFSFLSLFLFFFSLLLLLQNDSHHTLLDNSVVFHESINSGWCHFILFVELISGQLFSNVLSTQLPLVHDEMNNDVNVTEKSFVNGEWRRKGMYKQQRE